MKKLTTGLIAAAGLTLSMSAMASTGLQLCAKGTPSEITITCNGHNTGHPIPASSSGAEKCASVNGKTVLPWMAVAVIMESSKGQCVFKMAGKEIGRANLSIASGKGDLTAPYLDIGDKYNVNPNGYAYNTNAPYIHIDIQPANKK